MINKSDDWENSQGRTNNQFWTAALALAATPALTGGLYLTSSVIDSAIPYE